MNGQLSVELNTEKSISKPIFSRSLEAAEIAVMFLLLRNIFGLPVGNAGAALIGGGAYLLCSAAEKLWGRNAVLIPPFLCAAADLIFRSEFLNGFFGTANLVMQKFADKNHEIFSLIDCEKSDGLLFILSAAVIFSSLKIALDTKIFTFVCTAAMGILSVLFGGGIFTALYFILAAAELIYDVKMKNNCVFACFLAAPMFLAAVLSYMGAEEKIGGLPAVSAVESILTRQDIYKKMKQQDFEIELVMEAPQPVYLKIYTDENYENASQWSDDFYWLYKSGFYPQTQTSYLAEAVNSADISKITVNVKRGDFGSAIVPYGVTDCENLSISENKIGGEKIDLTGKNYYNFSVLNSYASDCDSLLYTLSANSESAQIRSYLSLEQVYREYVKAQYLPLEDSEKFVISNNFSMPESADADEIRLEILKYFSENISASDNTSFTQDIAQNVMEISRSGNQQDYARLTAELFRYCGVPARCCYGVTATQEMCKELAPNSSVTLDNADVHVWCEYYLDGVGWLPFETYPDYLEMNTYYEQYAAELSDMGGNVSSQTDSEQRQNADDDMSIGSEALTKENVSDIVVAVAVGSLLVVLLWILTVRAIWTVRIRLLRKDFDRAVLFWHRRAMKILELAGGSEFTFPEKNAGLISKVFGTELSDAYTLSENVFEKLKFSQIKITRKDAEICMDLFKMSVQAAKGKISVVRRIFYRLFMGIY